MQKDTCSNRSSSPNSETFPVYAFFGPAASDSVDLDYFGQSKFGDLFNNDVKDNQIEPAAENDEGEADDKSFEFDPELNFAGYNAEDYAESVNADNEARPSQYRVPNKRGGQEHYI
ncbi:hypothetical protein K4G61_g2587 [Candida parapsilosis]|nr:hypothetical protein K4G61_g2587 [Candida parapsilosis]